MLCYTSGTTGDPKGAILTHSCFLACCHSTDYFEFNFTEEDVAISYLPYGHVFEQNLFIFSWHRGYSHGYFSGDPLLLIQDVQTLKPTIFCTVPRILNRLYSKIWDGVNSAGGVKKWLFERAINTKRYYLQNQGDFNHRFYDKILKKVRDLMGGNVKHMVTGSAPINPDTLEFFKVVLGCHLHEAYG